MTVNKNAAVPYAGLVASLATQHGKERAIARPMRAALGLEVRRTSALDTDLLGTFSGEIAREGSALEVCERKARLGMQETGCRFGIASEGSFGPHPSAPFIAAGVEVMTFVDEERGFTLTESLIAEHTNFAHREARDVGELREWLVQVGFPAHALIVRTERDERGRVLAKGLQTHDALQDAIAEAARASRSGNAWIETDMRAHLNPTRMRSIRKLAFRLARRLAVLCPACTTPGWGRVASRKGLPCEACRLPTDFVRAEVFGCAVCEHSEELPRGDGLQAAAPQYCPYCNP